MLPAAPDSLFYATVLASQRHLDRCRINLASQDIRSTLIALQNVRLLREEEGLVLKICYFFIKIYLGEILNDHSKIYPCHSILFLFPWVGKLLIAFKVREIYCKKGMTVSFFFFLFFLLLSSLIGMLSSNKF